MPQVVACHGCGQHFMAADHLLGSVVACPSCGSSLAIPPPQPVATIAPIRTLLPADFRAPSGVEQQQRLIALIVVGAACALWLILATPNVLLWAFGRPAASVGRVGAGAVIFWVGIVLASGGVFEWSLFKYSRDMRATRAWFGEQGAKWFYAGLGSVAALLGLSVTAWATAYSLFGTTVNTQDRPDFAAQRQVVQPLAGPQVSRPPSQPPSNADGTTNAASSSPPPALAGENAAGEVPQTTRNDFRELPGQWRYLEGGYCVKVPATIVIDRDGLSNHDGDLRHDFGGCTKYADPSGVNFAVHVAISPRNREMDSQSLFDFKRRQPGPGESDIELILVNGLPIVKTVTQNTQTGPLNRKAYTLHGTHYHFAEEHCTVKLSVYSQLPVDHPEQQALMAYLSTFQRMPEREGADTAATGNASSDGWQLLEGGFRVKTSPALVIRVSQIQRSGRDRSETTHNWHGQTADGVEFKIDITHVPAWNKPNEAIQTAAERSRHPRPDYEHLAVEVNGLLMERITHRPAEGRPGRSTVEYRYLEGQDQIVMWVHSRLPLDHPSSKAVVRCFESIERLPRQ